MRGTCPTQQRPSLTLLSGMQVSVDTACSSALVGAHLAAQHLGACSGGGGSCLAAAVNLMLAETSTAAAQAAGMLTLDGRCKALDAAADGYARLDPCAPLSSSSPCKVVRTPP